MKPKDTGPAEPFRHAWTSLVPTTLYLDELRDAWRVLVQVGAVNAETDSWRDIESFEDLQKLESSSVKDFTMVGSSPDGERVTVHFGPSEASVTITSPRPEFLGVLGQVQQLVFRHWRKYSLADTGIFLLAMSALFSVVVASLAPFPWSLALAAAIVGVGSLLFYIGRLERKSRWSLLPMIWYANRPRSFVRQNRDQIIVNGIFMIVGAVLGVWLDRFLK